MSSEIGRFLKSLNCLLGILLAVLTIPASAQPFQCTNVTAPAPIVRAEGTAELMGDIVLDCTGGIPTPPGQQVPPVLIAVNLDTNMSSKVTAVSNQVQFLEALLIVDEPASIINPTVPILNCGNIGAPDDTQAGTGVCAIVGGGSDGAAATYNGTAGHPNVFQGRSFSLFSGQQNQVVFSGIPINPPGTQCPAPVNGQCHRILRITNIRGDAASFGVSGNSTMPVPAHLIANPFSGLPVDIPDSVVARIQQGLTSTVSASTVHLEEGFVEAWKPKNVSTSLANGAACYPGYSYGGGTFYPPDAAQNVSSLFFIYYTESGFEWQNNSTNGPPSPNPPCGGALPNLGNALSSSGLGGFNPGIDSAGVVNAGTRLALRFNIPLGASVQIPKIVQLHNVITNTITGVMVLTNTDSAGAGPFSPANGTLTSGSNLAVYEILFAHPAALESADVDFTLLGAPPNTTVQVTTSFAPVYSDSAANMASSTYPVPRFVPAITVSIDIKPGAFPNAINLKSGGTVPVAILSTPSFDARSVDPSTVTLAGASVKVKGQGDPMISFQDVNGDGLLDLVVRVNIDELQLSATDTQAILTGQKFDGQSIRGVDSVKLTH
jgi:hypothetical protein